VYGCSDEKLITLLMDMKSQLDTVTHQQQLILQEMVKKRAKSTPQLPAGIMLPLQTFDQVQSLERKLLNSATDKLGLVRVYHLLDYLSRS